MEIFVCNICDKTILSGVKCVSCNKEVCFSCASIKQSHCSKCEHESSTVNIETAINEAKQRIDNMSAMEDTVDIQENIQ